MSEESKQSNLDSRLILTLVRLHHLIALMLLLLALGCLFIAAGPWKRYFYLEQFNSYIFIGLSVSFAWFSIRLLRVCREVTMQSLVIKSIPDSDLEADQLLQVIAQIFEEQKRSSSISLRFLSHDNLDQSENVSNSDQSSLKTRRAGQWALENLSENRIVLAITPNDRNSKDKIKQFFVDNEIKVNTLVMDRGDSV